MPPQHVPAFLGALCERRVDLDVEIKHLSTGEQLNRLRDGDLDLGFLHDATGPTLGVEVDRLRRGEALAAVLGPTHRLASREAARLNGFAGDVLLAVPRHAEPGLHARVVALADSDGTPFREIRDAPGHDARDLLLAVASDHLPAAGDLGKVVAASLLDPATWMPDTWLAWPADSRPELNGLHADARAIAHAMYPSLEIPTHIRALLLRDLAHSLERLDGWLHARNRLLAAGTTLGWLDGLIADSHRDVRWLRHVLAE
jgi:hypothetical protein